MSHFSTVQTKLKDVDVLEAALEACGYSVKRNAQVRGYQGGKAGALLVASKAQLGAYDLGFNNKDGMLSAVADWWGLGCYGLTQEDALNQVSQQYAKILSTQSLEAQGFTLTEEMEGDQIVLTATRWR